MLSSEVRKFSATIFLGAKNIVKHYLILLTTILLLSCSFQNTSTFKVKEDISNVEVKKENPKDWRKIEEEFFSFSIPSTMKKNDVRGIDSIVLEFENDEINLGIEYGDYSGDLNFIRQNYENQIEQAKIDGENVVIVSCDLSKPNVSGVMMTKNAQTESVIKAEKNYFVGVSFPNRMKAFGQTAISFEATCKNLEAREAAKIILRSIKFK